MVSARMTTATLGDLRSANVFAIKKTYPQNLKLYFPETVSFFLRNIFTRISFVSMKFAFVENKKIDSKIAKIINKKLQFLRIQNVTTYSPPPHSRFTQFSL
jgi:hypothetical protein